MSRRILARLPGFDVSFDYFFYRSSVRSNRVVREEDLLGSLSVHIVSVHFVLLVYSFH